MPSDPSDDVVELETWIAASPEAVFPFLTHPGRRAPFMAQRVPLPGELLFLREQRSACGEPLLRDTTG